METMGTGFVFTYYGRPIGSPKTAWRKMVRAADLPGFRWHDLRHTWASWHAMNGIPLDVLRQIGGWQTQSMVQRYAHLAPSYLAQFANNGEPMATKVDTGKAKGRFRPRSSVDRATPS